MAAEFIRELGSSAGLSVVRSEFLTGEEGFMANLGFVGLGVMGSEMVETGCSGRATALRVTTARVPKRSGWSRKE